MSVPGKVVDSMGTVGYLYRRIFKNRVRMALRKPVTYVYVVMILFYICVLPFSLRMAAQTYSVDSPSGMAAVLTLLAFWTIPANLSAYARRKGLVYRNCDVHFLFPSPVSPKWVLLYAHLRTLFLMLVLNVFAVACGRIMFQVEIWKLAVYFVFAVGVENVLEGCFMLLLYGSERLDEEKRKLVVWGARALVGVLVLLGIYTYLQEGLSFRSVVGFLHSDMVQMVPVIGWYIAVVHLLFTGATTVNVIGSILYGILLVVSFLLAVRMKCTGAFYEDAIRFAEDYEEVLASRRQGNIDRKLGKKQKFGKARVAWRGHGARALFYRQLLEYKKNKYFIFDANTVVALLAGIGMAWLYTREGGFREEGMLGPLKDFAVPAVSAYFIFIFTSMSGKWGKELLSPYTYLIPDTPFHKLLYATAMQHIQSLVNGCLITLPVAVVMGMDPLITVLCILFYAILSANKLYALAVAEAVVGGTLGRTGKQMFQLFIQGIVIMMAVVGGILGMGLGGIVLSYVMMDVFLALATVVFMVIATLNFYKLES